MKQSSYLQKPRYRGQHGVSALHQQAIQNLSEKQRMLEQRRAIENTTHLLGSHQMPQIGQNYLDGQLSQNQQTGADIIGSSPYKLGGKAQQMHRHNNMSVQKQSNNMFGQRRHTNHPSRLPTQSTLVGGFNKQKLSIDDSDTFYESLNGGQQHLNVPRSQFFSPQHKKHQSKINQTLEKVDYGMFDWSSSGPSGRKVNGIQLPVVGCMPGCTHKHEHGYDYDFSKNYEDALNQRPGEFAEYNWLAANYHLLQQEKKGVVCDGILQTPINLDTAVPISHTFEDPCFSFKYADIDPKEQLKFNQKGQQYQLVMKNDKPNDNVLVTSTISLFDKNCDTATLQGLQYHFHAPSEHSINGKLLDLEMHIVHGLVQNENQKTKFTNGVLGFFFKAVPDDFKFTDHGLTDYHDNFLRRMLIESKGRPRAEKKMLDLTKFVELLKYNSRWTYTGSLTTAPFSEGILWNVLKNVIPIRQSTLDLFLEYRKIEESTVFNKFVNEHDKNEVAAKLSIQPKQMKPFHTEYESFFRVAACNRVVQDNGNRPIYHVDTDPYA